MNARLEDFLTELYYHTDEWCQQLPAEWLKRTGPKPTFSDSEVLTLCIAQPLCGIHSEHEWVRFVHNNLKHLFPKMLSQSEFNRRVRNLMKIIAELFRYLLDKIGMRFDPHRIVDSAPICVRHWKRHGPHHIAMEGATLGYCAAKDQKFYGYRLMLLITPSGIITDFELIPADMDERLGAEDLLENYRNLMATGDKGFVSESFQQHLRDAYNIQLYALRRCNQHQQLPKEFARLIHLIRHRIENVFSLLTDLFNIEHPGARTLWGLLTRINVKITAFLFAVWFNIRAGRSATQIAGLQV